MRYLVALLLGFIVLFSVFSCEPEEEIITRSPRDPLQFSTDTVQFDTVFVIDPTYPKNASVTKRLQVYNFNKNAVLLEEIKLGGLGNSPFKVTINGKRVPQAKDVRILGNDSLLILVEVFIPPGTSNKPFKVEDVLSFRLNNVVQNIPLIASGQNAIFYRNQILTCNTTWTAEKPHIIYGSVKVNAGCSLTIEKGARIYLHKDAIIDIEGTLLVNGTAAERVIFDGDRPERFYNEIPGQWKGIEFSGTSKNNILQFADINNADIGIQATNADRNPATFDIRLENCIIKNMFTGGIISVGSDIQVINSLITNCGQVAVAGFGGGGYDFKYCTIANYHNRDFDRESPSFLFSDQLADGNQSFNSLLKISMVNSIIWGDKRNNKLTEEMSISNPSGQPAILDFRNNILQTDRYKTVFNSTNKFNEDPRFVNTPVSVRPIPPFNYSLSDFSPAIEAGTPISGITTDLLNKPRDPNKPDIGAYEKQ